MPAFSSSFNADSKTTEVTLLTDLSQKEWNELMEFYQQKIAGGSLHWDLDLRQLDFITSMSLGMIVGLNTSLSTRGGSLRLVMSRGSKVAHLIHLTKLDRIVDVAIV